MAKLRKLFSFKRLARIYKKRKNKRRQRYLEKTAAKQEKKPNVKELAAVTTPKVTLRSTNTVNLINETAQLVVNGNIQSVFTFEQESQSIESQLHTNIIDAAQESHDAAIMVDIESIITEIVNNCSTTDSVTSTSVNHEQNQQTIHVRHLSDTDFDIIRSIVSNITESAIDKAFTDYVTALELKTISISILDDHEPNEGLSIDCSTNQHSECIQNQFDSSNNNNIPSIRPVSLIKRPKVFLPAKFVIHTKHSAISMESSKKRNQCNDLDCISKCHIRILRYPKYSIHKYNPYRGPKLVSEMRLNERRRYEKAKSQRMRKRQRLLREQRTLEAQEEMKKLRQYRKTLYVKAHSVRKFKKTCINLPHRKIQAKKVPIFDRAIKADRRRVAVLRKQRIIQDISMGLSKAKVFQNMIMDQQNLDGSAQSSHVLIQPGLNKNCQIKDLKRLQLRVPDC